MKRRAERSSRACQYDPPDSHREVSNDNVEILNLPRPTRQAKAARARRLTPERRSEIARETAAARWGDKA